MIPLRTFALGASLLACFPPAGPARAQAGVLQCVPFARALSGIAIFGDAWKWWNNAAARFDRGQIPLPGSVLNFRPRLGMPLGHVAVVTQLLGNRLIEIDHANWSAPGAITRGALVADVSPRNDWSLVRVELGSGPAFGQVYQTFGFIYGRPLTVAEIARQLQPRQPQRPPQPERIDVAARLAQAARGPAVVDVAAFLDRPRSRRVARLLRN